MKIYVFLANGFEEIEAIAPIDIFRRAGIEAITVSINETLEVTGAHNIKIIADNIFDSTTFDEQAMLFLPGGLPGTTNLDNHTGLKALILKYAENKNNIAAICAAPSVFGKIGLLNGKEAICYPGFENLLIGASLSELNMVKAENVYTAKAAGTALEFALLIVSNLKGAETADAIRKGMFIN